METLNHIMGYTVKSTEMLFASYFTISCLYVLAYAVAGHFYKKQKHLPNQKLNKLAVFIPAYKEDAVIVEVAQKALFQQYPPSFFDVIIIADSLQDQTLNNLKKLPIKLVEVSFENSTKAKALNAAMNSLTKTYNYAIILDADNIMEPSFFNQDE